jgi:hypothetical protein
LARCTSEQERYLHRGRRQVAKDYEEFELTHVHIDEIWGGKTTEQSIGEIVKTSFSLLSCISSLLYTEHTHTHTHTPAPLINTNIITEVREESPLGLRKVG